MDTDSEYKGVENFETVLCPVTTFCFNYSGTDNKGYPNTIVSCL